MKMGLWNRLFGRELRAEVITADDSLMRILKGIEISPETALEIPAVSACVAFISSCIAGLPIKLYRENRNQNSTEEIKDDVRLRLLNDETGDLLDPFQMKQAVVNDYFLYGGGFIYPEMNGNEFVSLRYIKHGAITSFLSGADPIFKVGEYVLSNGMRLRDDEVVRLLRDTKDGLTGESVVIQHQQLLSAMYREIVYEKLLVSSGGNKKGFLTSESKLSPEMLADLRQKWQEMYANTGNNMMILNKGITFHESSNTSVEMQLNENKARNNALVCQLFGMSPEAVSGQLGEDALAAVIKGAVVPVITAFEAALNRGLLLPSERDWMYFVFDTTELLKGDILKRYQAYKTGLECNVLQIDEARYKEDLPPLGLNWIKLGLQDVLYDPKTKTIYTPNMNQSMTMSENQVSFGENAVDTQEQDGIMEERDYIQNPDTGKMEGSTGGGASSGGGGSVGGSGGDSEEALSHLTVNYPKGFVDVRQVGERISDEKLTEFADKVSQSGMSFAPMKGCQYGGFENYCGDPAVLDDLLIHLQVNQKTLTAVSGSGRIVLGYDYIKVGTGAVDVSTFAVTKGRTITFNKYYYDDSSFLAREYDDAVKSRLFAKGTTYLNVPDHECGHIFAKYDKRYLTGLQRVCDDRAAKSGMSSNDFMEAHISSYASYLNELPAEINSMRYGSYSGFALGMLKEAGLV